MALNLASIIGTVVIGNKAVSIISTVGASLIINTLTSTTTSICKIISSLTSYNQPNIRQIINELNSIDIEYTVKVIEQLVIEQDNKKTTDSIKIALIGVNEVLEQIHNELKMIQEAINKHLAKYFNYWRPFDCSYILDMIRKHKELLDNRYKILINLLQIYK